MRMPEEKLREEMLRTARRRSRQDTASAAHSKLGPSGLRFLVARGLLRVGVPPSGGRRAYTTKGRGREEKEGWGSGILWVTSSEKTERWPLSPSPQGGGPELRGFPLPRGNPVLLSSEGWNCSHDFGTSQTWDFRANRFFVRTCASWGTSACSQAWASGISGVYGGPGRWPLNLSRPPQPPSAPPCLCLPCGAQSLPVPRITSRCPEFPA